jgi:hypothetical protein
VCNDRSCSVAGSGSNCCIQLLTIGRSKRLRYSVHNNRNRRNNLFCALFIVYKGVHFIAWLEVAYKCPV